MVTVTAPLRSPWLGWLVAALLGALWWAQPRHDVSSPAAEPAAGAKGGADTGSAAETAHPDPWSERVALLTECRAKIREQHDTRATCECDADGRPRDRATLGKAGRDETAIDDRPSELSADAGASHAAERQAMKALLGVNDKEADWLATYLCAVADLRSATLEDLRAAGVTSSNPDATATEQALEDARRQRTAMLDDLKARLGHERYAQLRSVGGLSLVGSMLDCER